MKEGNKKMKYRWPKGGDVYSRLFFKVANDRKKKTSLANWSVNMAEF